MPNKLAIEFVENLCAAFCRYPITKETKSLYVKKLSAWPLSRELWEYAFDRIVRENQEGSLPQLSIIFAELKRQQLRSKNDNPLGYAYFQLNGNDHAIRIKVRDGVWIITDLVSTDSNGEAHHLQDHVGDPVARHIPVDATHYHIAPDDPPLPGPDKMPTDEERMEIIREINKNLARIGGRI